jgi:glycosyltransferase involved in cell wall biosynthesis
VRALHVGLNLVYLQPDSGGSGTYARELIDALLAVEPETRITAWVGQGAPDALDPRVDWVHLPVKSTGSPVHVPVELGWLGLDARRRGVDLVHGLAYASPVIAPGVATLVTILDLTWLHHPETVSVLARRMFGLLSPLCGRTADRVIAISETVRDDLVTTLGLDAGKIEVTPLGVSDTALAEPEPEARLRARLGLPADAPVLLSVAQMAAHKNLGVLVDALPRLADQRAFLVMPGRRTPYAEELEARARALGVGDRLVLPGFVDDAALEGLYALADAFLLPSLLEGFGLPVLEAMRRGVPVACSAVSALPEVAGGAALLFDPHDVDAVTAAADRLLGDGALREDLRERGRARAAELTWEATARATLRAYRRALDSRVVSRA